MPAHALAERSTKAQEATPRRAAARPGVSQTLLAAGNMALQRLARERVPAQAIQRCGPGGCTCGGKCGGQAEEEELLGAAAIRRAVADRRTG